MTREGASAFALAAEQLGDAMKMLVPRDQTQVIFQRECSDPQIVVGNRGAGTLELDEQTRVMFGRFPAREQNRNGCLCQKLMQQILIPAVLRTTVKSCLDLSQNHQWYPDFVAGPQPIRQFTITLEKIS